MTTNPTYKVNIFLVLVTNQKRFFLLQPSEGKREEFRRYLEKTGVMDALTKGLVSLYEEPDKPSDALQYPLLTLYKKKAG